MQVPSLECHHKEERPVSTYGHLREFDLRESADLVVKTSANIHFNLIIQQSAFINPTCSLDNYQFHIFIRLHLILRRLVNISVNMAQGKKVNKSDHKYLSILHKVLFIILFYLWCIYWDVYLVFGHLSLRSENLSYQIGGDVPIIWTEIA